MADVLASSAQVQARFQTSSGTGVVLTAADIALLTELMEEVTDFCQQYTGRRFLPITSADYIFDTVAGSALHIPLGIRAVTFLGVASTSQPDSGGTYTTVAAADFYLRPKPQDQAASWPFTSILLSASGPSVRYFSNARNGAKVTMTAGFASVPLDMQAVGIEATVAAYQKRRNGASDVIGMDDMAVAPWRTFFSRGSPQRATLDRYREFAV